MSYNAENFKKIAEEYSNKSKIAEEKADERKLELQKLFPEIKEIDTALSKVGLKILSAAVSGDGDIEKKIAELKKPMTDRKSVV